MPQQVGPVDSSVPLAVNITGLTEHVVVYHVQYRDASNGWQWQALGDGTLPGPNVPVHFVIPAGHVSPCQIWYSFALSDPYHPNSAYDVRLTLVQNNQVVPGGLIDKKGVTDASGDATVEDWANVQ